MSRLTGTIKKLLADKYCGFIQVNDSRNDYFFHVSSLNPETLPYMQLREGMVVEFTEEPSPKGLRAGNVVVVN